MEDAFAGNWAARVVALVRIGVRFARGGADLFDWEAANEAVTAVVRSALVTRFADDREQLLATLAVLQSFSDRSFCAFSEAYVGAAQDVVYEAEALMRLSSVGQAIVDEGGILHRPNQAFLDLYGLTAGEAEGLKFLSLFEPAALIEVQGDLFEEARRRGRLGYDTTHLRANGVPFPVRVEAVRIQGDRAGGTWGMLLYDLTERKLAESVRAGSIELEAENFRIRESSRAKSEFLANMSHELRTPLNSILGFSQLLAANEVGELSDQQRDFVADIHESGRHLLRLISDVLDLSKVEAGKIELHAEETDLHGLVADVVSMARGLGQVPIVEVHLDPMARTACLDPGRFKQVVLNYLSNAIKFSPATEPISIRLEAAGDDAVRLSVRDRGAGIAASDLGRLFVPFEQLDAGRGKKHGGTGLGLALTKQIVEAQGGTVGVESCLGIGSTFHAVLPRYQPSPP